MHFFFVSSSPILFKYLHTQAAGSHERSMVRASGARSEPFLLCPSCQIKLDATRRTIEVHFLFVSTNVIVQVG